MLIQFSLANGEATRVPNLLTQTKPQILACFHRKTTTALITDITEI